MLFRKKGTAPTILAIALLIALITSVTSLVNNINQQTNALSKLASIGGDYMIVSQNSTSLTDSKVETSTANLINSSDIQNIIPQKTSEATIQTATGKYSIILHGVSDPQIYFSTKPTNIKGSISANETQANVGNILSNLASLNVNDLATLTVADKSLQVNITSITQTSTQTDTEVIVPLATINALIGNNDTVSFIEFTVKASSDQTTSINQISKLIPANDKITKTQQLDTFAQDTTTQIVSFLNLWSIAVYAIVIAASYVVATRLITESKYELSMFRTLGAQKRYTIKLVLVYSLATAFVGSVFGLAIGMGGAQIAATAVRWTWGNFQLSPFLEAEQAIQILILAIISSILGSIYPALKSSTQTSKEALL